MPVLRKHRTSDEIAAAEEKKRQEKIIHHWQVLAMDNLYFRDKAIQDFIVALREHCAYEAGTTASIDEMSTAIGMAYKKTCEMLEQPAVHPFLLESRFSRTDREIHRDA